MSRAESVRARGSESVRRERRRSTRVAARARAAAIVALGLLFRPAIACAQGWSAEERVSVTSADSETGLSRAPLAVDSRGRAHIVWCEQDGAALNYQIDSRTRSLTAWGATERAVAYAPEYPGSAGGAKYPAIVAGEEDSLHIVWHDYRVGGIQNVEIFTKSRSADAAWDTTGARDVRLTHSSHPETNGDNSYVPSLYRAPGGELGIVWFDFRFDNENAEILMKARTAGASGAEWDTTAGDAPDVNVSATGGNSSFPAVAAAPDGVIHVVWMEQAGAVSVLHRARDASTGAWGATEIVATGEDVVGYPAAAVDPSGALHVLWTDAREGSQAIFGRTRAASGLWGSASRVSPANVNAQEPAIAASLDGALHAAWHDTRVSLLNREIFVQTRSAAGAWDPSGASDVRLSNAAANSTRPSLLADAFGNLHVLWKDRRDGNGEIYYRVWRNPALTGVPGRSDERSGASSGDAAFDGPLVSARVFPNPVRDGATGVVDLGRAGPVAIALYDAAGRRVREVWSGTALAGTHALSLDFGAATHASLAPGVYFLRVDAGHGAASARVLVLPAARGR